MIYDPKFANQYLIHPIFFPMRSYYNSKVSQIWTYCSWWFFQKHLFKLMIVLIFFVPFRILQHNQRRCFWPSHAHIYYIRGRFVPWYFHFHFHLNQRLTSNIDYAVHCVRTFWSQIGKGQRTSLLIVEVFLAPKYPLFCFPNVLLWKYKLIFSAFLLIPCSSNYGGGIILTLNK